MGIRYYAYAFDAEFTERALADPHSILSSDPLADAWGLTPHAALSVTTFQRRVPKRDMLYLDKAWGGLQRLTGPDSPDPLTHPSYRMFEGDVTMTERGWIPWVRTLIPDEIPAIAQDLSAIDDADCARLRGSWDDDGFGDYVANYLRDARAFAAGLAAEGRGMVYMIG